MMLALPLYLQIQVMPPPLAHWIAVLALGTDGGGVTYSMPADCGCGVPSSPRGPR